MEGEVLEAVFQKFQDERCVARVLNISEGAGLPKGENYMSNITKMVVEVVLGSGRKSKRRFVLKSLPDGEEKIKMQQELGVFKQEIMMYSVVLKEMEYLMDEYQDTSGPIWCSCYHYKPYSAILLEDLHDTGFKVMNRKNYLDLDHARLTLRNFARSHAMSKILETRGIISENDFKPFPFIHDLKIIKYVLMPNLKVMKDVMANEWGPPWSNYSHLFNLPVENVIETLAKIGQVDHSRFNVLNHGDCWTTNMMFKHDLDGKPIAHRMLDFQIPHYNSFAWDVTYFMFSSVDPEIRRRNFDNLLETYYTTLKDYLLRFEYSGKVPELLDVYSEMERISFFRLMALIINAATSYDGTDAFDLELALSSSGKEGVSRDIYTNEKFKRNVGPDLLEMVNHLISEKL